MSKEAMKTSAKKVTRIETPDRDRRRKKRASWSPKNPNKLTPMELLKYELDAADMGHSALQNILEQRDEEIDQIKAEFEKVKTSNEGWHGECVKLMEDIKIITGEKFELEDQVNQLNDSLQTLVKEKRLMNEELQAKISLLASIDKICEAARWMPKRELT